MLFLGGGFLRSDLSFAFFDGSGENVRPERKALGALDDLLIYRRDGAVHDDRVLKTTWYEY